MFPMWTQKRLREPRRAVTSPPAGIQWEEFPGRASFAAWEEFSSDVLQWEGLPDSEPVEVLRQAMVTGFLGGPWLCNYPKYVWHRDGDGVLEFRLTGRLPGEYTGYHLHPSEWPEGLT